MRKSAVVFAVLHTLPLGSHPREKESADVADAGCQFISRASFQETVRLNVWQCDCWHTCKINRVYTGCILHFLFRHLLFIFIHFQPFRWSFLHCNGWVRGYKVLTCMAMDIVEILQLFWGLSMRTVTNIHVSTSFFRFSEPTHHQTIHLKMRPSNLQGIENGSHDAALRGACSARHGMNGEDPADLEQQLLRPNIAQRDPAVTDDFWCSSWTLKGLETHHLAKWTWQMFERYFFRRF